MRDIPGDSEGNLVSDGETVPIPHSDNTTVLAPIVVGKSASKNI